ncbi:splicing factor U2af large subunit B [Ziziphus jujuba]|uniref:Splicing factor U2af large subunit B n=1 Tax=Ziziphus jujuba TaxID=326968 RepID=A0A6P3ZJ91_ZIZJJ|nr:splicing factor U2af large subunit B [Ziziphus jujuba]
MNTYSRHKEKNGKSSRVSVPENDEGSAARTRPFSFEEIMLRRKNKNLTENVNEGALGGEIRSREDIVEHVSRGFESERDYGHLKDSSPIAEKYPSEEPVKQSSRNEEKNTSLNANSRGDFDRGKDSGSHGMEIKVKARLKSIVNEVKGGLNDSQIYDRRKNEVNSRKEEKNTGLNDNQIYDRRKNEVNSRKIEKNTNIKAKYEDDFHKGKDSRSGELETKLKSRPHKMDSKVKGGKYDRETFGRGKYDKLSANSIPNKAEKRHSKDMSVKESHADQSKGNSERERKRKYENGDDEKAKGRISAKKHDPGRHHDSDISERKDRREWSKLHVEESRLKRRRSRSKEHEDRNRRSTSHSPRANKHTSSYRGEHKQLPTHSLKDRSGRLHSDVDRSRVSNNGSSSQYLRNDDFASGIGGYSPRKRRTEAAARTPPPASHLPEKKSAKWDLPPAATDNTLSSSVPSSFESSVNTVSSNAPQLASAIPVTSTTMKPMSGVFANALSTKKFASFDSVQLTQATRPMRRLYVENVPSSISEKALVEYINGLLLSSGVNHVQGTQPCISCIINNEKGQALLEFLTPEDASAALSFDCSSISGSTLKLRRPKDFVDVATGDPDKSMTAVDTISNVVKDSPNKVFIGGISKSLSSKMLLEIVSAFGPLKAYHFEINEDLNEPCAFLEYADQSVTVKACAGLNGMKLGGKVLTVLQAVHGAASLENTAGSSLYKIPEHAKPLLMQPTQIIKLKNVFNVEDLSSLSEQEVEDIVEDIRLECSRFGTVKSVNVVRKGNSQITTSGACEIIKNTETTGLEQNSGCEIKNVETDTFEAHRNGEVSGSDSVDNLNNVELKEDGVATGEDDKPADCMNTSSSIHEELSNRLNSPKEVLECSNDKVADTISTDDIGSENKLVVEEESCLEEEVDGKEQKHGGQLDGSVGAESHEMGKVDMEDDDSDVGSVFVEFGRVEASCTAAHCLNGRLYDDRIVTVDYVAPDYYRKRFPK